MAKKKNVHEFLGLFIKVICPVKNEEVTIQLTEYDIMATNQECELCGSHGDITVDFKCPLCGESHSHEIRGW